jgi:hypothetical protein
MVFEFATLGDLVVRKKILPEKKQNAFLWKEGFAGRGQKNKKSTKNN